MSSSLKKIVLFLIVVLFMQNSVHAMETSKKVEEAEQFLQEQTDLKFIERICINIINVLKKKSGKNTALHRSHELERNMQAFKSRGDKVFYCAEKIVRSCGLPGHLKAEIIPFLIALYQAVLIKFGERNTDKKFARTVYIYCTNYIIERYHSVKIV